MTGANHDGSPTDGSARYRSGLSTDDFVRWTTHQSINPTRHGPSAGMSPLSRTRRNCLRTRRPRAGGPANCDCSPLLGRSVYRGLACYVVDQAPVRIDLRDNTNLWGSPCSARCARLQRLPGPYADIHWHTPRGCNTRWLIISRFDPGMVVTGCGSDDVIDASFRALGDPGDPHRYAVTEFLERSVVRADERPNAGPLSTDERLACECRSPCRSRRTLDLSLFAQQSDRRTHAPARIERLLAHATAVVIID